MTVYPASLAETCKEWMHGGALRNRKQSGEPLLAARLGPHLKHPPRACRHGHATISYRSAEDKLWINQRQPSKDRESHRHPKLAIRALIPPELPIANFCDTHSRDVQERDGSLKERQREHGSIHDENLVFFDIEKRQDNLGRRNLV